jgi:hypothetical protein
MKQEYTPATFVAELYHLKQTLARPPLNYREVLEPNITHSILEMLIALFCHKYKISHEELREAMRKIDGHSSQPQT